MIGLMDIYNNCPIFMQNIFTSLQGYKYKKERFGTVYEMTLESLKKRDYTDEKGLKEYQNRRFRELLHYAVKESPFYKEFYKDIDLSKIKTVDDIKLLPVLPKETVRQRIADMYAVSPEEGIESNTSGTTGTTMRFYYTEKDLQRRMAYLDFFKYQHGFTAFEMKRASFNSAKIVPPNQKANVFWRDNLSIKQRIYSGYHCKGKNLKYIVDNLNEYKPESLDGYPSAMYELARYIIDNDVRLTFTPVAIFPTAEMLLPHYKEAIEKAFGCPVRDQYASSEGAPFITECKCGKLHYCIDTGIIEFDDDGEMIVTCFETHGTPLIRYKIGDRAFLSENQECECGCKMPVVDRIEGRTLDYIQTKSNGKMTAIYLSLVSAEFDNSVKAMQFIQNDADSVDVYLVTDDKYKSEMDKIILDKLNYNLGPDMTYRIHLVDELHKDPSGKCRLIINKIS